MYKNFTQMAPQRFSRWGNLEAQHLLRRLRFLFVLAVMFVGILTVSPMAFAQTETDKPTATKEKKPPAPTAPQAQGKPQLELPSAPVTLMLIRSTLMTFNDALATGNFTVLRDVASPSFQAANSPEQLRQIFANPATTPISNHNVSMLFKIINWKYSQKP